MQTSIPSLKSYPWNRTYKSNHHALVAEFFVPALERSILYLRVAGYFSSSVLTVAAAGIAKLIHNGGEMQMIVGADLSPDDVDAMNRGAMNIGDFVQKAFTLEYEKLNDLERFIAEERHKALYWLIANGRLKIKIAVLVDDDGRVKQSSTEGIFHEKWGMFYDREKNSIGFIGSDNETGQAWTDNQERFKVFRSWTDEMEYFTDEVDDFKSYWDDAEPGIRIYEITDAVEKKLIRYKSSEPPTGDPWEDPQKIQSFREKQGSHISSAGKLLGMFGGLQFLEPDQFRAYVTAQFIQHCYAIDHGWRSLLETVPFTPLEHQTIIAHEIYNHFPRGYMLCDEVGLGKTVEAGLAIKWLVMAGLVKRVLVIVPKNVIVQWQEELREKFNLEFLIYDPPSLVSYWNEVYEPRSANAYNAHDFILVSSGLLKLDARIEEILDASNWDLLVIDEAHHLRRKPPKSKSAVGTAGKLLTLAQKLKLKTKCFLMLTATPIQMRIEELFDLLQLLGLGGKWGLRDHFAQYYEILSRAPNARSSDQWAFLVQMALDFLKHGRINPSMYESELRSFDERPRYLRELLEIFIKGYDFLPYLNAHKSDAEFLDELSEELETLTPLRWFMFRNTRQQLKRYGIHVATRDPKDESISMTADERDLYHQVEQYIVDIYNNAEEEQKPALGFTLAVYRRRLTSSFMAIKKTLIRRKETIVKLQNEEIAVENVDWSGEAEEEDAAEDEVLAGLGNIGGGTQAVSITSPAEPDSIYGDEGDAGAEDGGSKASKPRFVLATGSYDAEIEYIDRFIWSIDELLETKEDSKFIKLKEILDEANKEDAKRVLVFTQYTDTLDYLKERIRRNPDYQELGAYSGDGGEQLVHDAEHDTFTWKACTKEDIKAWFFKPGTFKIMLATDAASEGLNFHVCSWLVNYDLPWNPMRVEQRIGRIDRVKQEADTLKIFNLMYTNTIEGRIYKRLWDRIRIFHNAVGPLQPILNVYQKAEHFAISEGDDRLDDDQIDDMLGDIKEEMQRATERQDFFQRLLVQRVLPDVSRSVAETPVVTANEEHEWLRACLESKLARKVVPGTIIEHEFSAGRVSIRVESTPISPLFALQGAKASFKSVRQKAKRDLRNRKITCDLTNDAAAFEKLGSGYFFTTFDTIHDNLIKHVNGIIRQSVPASFTRPATKTDPLNIIDVLCWIDLSGHPYEKNGRCVAFSYDLQHDSISNWREFFKLGDLKNILTDITNAVSDDFQSSILDAIGTNLPRLKKNLKKEVKDKMDTQGSKGAAPRAREEPISIMSTQQENTQVTVKEKLLEEIKKWLITGVLAEQQPEQWEFLPMNLRTSHILEKINDQEVKEKLEEIIDLFGLRDNLDTIKKDDALVTTAVTIYKNKKRYKVLGADRARVLNGIVESFNTWLLERQAYINHELEFEKSRITNKPHISIIAIIIHNM